MDVVVEVGAWEHECCGAPIERNQIVDLSCLCRPRADGETILVETHHHVVAAVRVKGRVSDIQVLREAGTAQAIDRLPGGPALRGEDPADDGHLEDPVTGQPLAAGHDFLVTVQVPD